MRRLENLGQTAGHVDGRQHQGMHGILEAGLAELLAQRLAQCCT